MVALSKLRPAVSSPGRAQQRRELRQMDVGEVLRQLREPDSESSEISRRQRGLSTSRLSAAVSFLLAKGLLERTANGKSRASSRNRALGINAGYGHVVGVDIGASNLRIALADMSGSVLDKWSASTRETSSPDMVIEQIRGGVKCLLQRASLPMRSLLAVAAGAPGITDGDAGVVMATSYLRGWKDVRLRRLLESALRIPAAVENDVRMAAIGENWRGAARGVGNFVFLAIGTGIAAGVFANGRLIHGADWTAGEIGYMHVPGGPEEAAGERDPGSLESVIGGEGIQQQWLRGCVGTGETVSRDLSATEIFERARAGDQLAERILNRSAKMLAYAVYNISLVLNCSLFVLGGGVGMSEPLLDSTRRFLEAYSEPARPKLTVSSLGPDAQLIGAVRLALNQADSQIGLVAGD
ncbi:MAG: ROK family protein [Candidatus Sulfotelmatobacter sp.]